MNGKRLLLWSVAVFVLVVVGATVWLTVRPSQPLKTLSDGTKLRLLTTTFGKTHRLRLPLTNIWEALFPFRGSYQMVNTDADSLVLWLEIQGKTGSTNGGNTSPQTLWDWIQVEDETGSQCSLVQPMQATITSVATIYNVPLDHFPRRGKRLTIRCFRYRKDTQETSFTVANPTSGNFHEITPEPLPVARQSGDLSVSLEQVLAKKIWYVELPGRPGWITQISDEESANYFLRHPDTTVKLPGYSSQIIADVRWRGKPTQEWDLASMKLTDGGGNSIQGIADVSWSGWHWTNGKLDARLYGEWASKETLGQLRLEFVRGNHAIIPDTEQVKCELKAPAPGALVATQQKEPSLQQPVDIYLNGTGTVSLTKTIHVSTNVPFLWVFLPSDKALAHTIVRVTGEDGRTFTRISAKGFGGGSSSSMNVDGLTAAYRNDDGDDQKTQVLGYFLPKARPGEKLHIALALNRSRTLDFNIAMKPPQESKKQP